MTGKGMVVKVREGVSGKRREGLKNLKIP